MNNDLTRRDAMVLLLLPWAGTVAAEDASGTFGFAAKIDVDGIFSPTLNAASIQSVQPGLPAAQAGVAVGDQIIEVDGVKVAGSKASAMAERMKKKPGETVVLKLTRPNGESYIASLKAAPRGVK